MSNEYKSFYLGELLAIIDRVALSCMAELNPAGQNEGLNNNIAWKYSGIRDMAFWLKKELEKDGETDG